MVPSVHHSPATWKIKNLWMNKYATNIQLTTHADSAAGHPIDAAMQAETIHEKEL